MADPTVLSAGVQKVVDKLRASLDGGDHYEAQQMLKTVYHRCRARRQFTEAYQLLQEGARVQLEGGQLNCGIELALLLAEDYTSDKLPVDEAAMQRLIGILHAFPTGSGGTEGSEGVTRFMGAALQWCRGCGGRREDEALLHDSLAHYLWEDLRLGGLPAVTAHYARGRDRYAFATVLMEAAAEGEPDEEDLFVARALLQTLAVAPAGRDAAAVDTRREGVDGGVELLDAYESVAGRALPDTPLVHFLRLLLQALGTYSSLKLVRILRREYEPALRRDRSFKGMLDRLEELWFGVRQQGGMGGILGDLMQMLAAPS